MPRRRRQGKQAFGDHLRAERGSTVRDSSFVTPVPAKNSESGESSDDFIVGRLCLLKASSRLEVTHPEAEAVFALRSLGAGYDWAIRNVSEFKWMKF
jgi:hypothetical protein